MTIRIFHRWASLAALPTLFLAGCSLDAAPEEIHSKSAALVSAGGLDAELVLTSQWPSGYCAEVRLHNQHPSEMVSSWDVEVDLGGTSLQNAWNSTNSQENGILQLGPVGWNAQIAPDQHQSVGFCASRSSSNLLPSLISVSDDLPSDAGDPEVIELTVANLDDFLYLTVNGVRSKIVPIQSASQTFDVSEYFVKGSNEARIQVINTGGPVNYSVQLHVDGELVLNESCNGDCDPSVTADIGILLDETVNLEMENLPEAQLVTLDSASSGAVYLNNQYMGVSTPTALLLPPGEFVVGLGQGNNTVGSFSGEFYEQTVTVADSQLEVQLGQGAALPVQHQTRIAVLPARLTYHGSADDVGLLDDNDVVLMEAQMQATSDVFVKPFSYGLTSWEFTMLPVVEDVPLLRVADPYQAPQTSQFLSDIGQPNLGDDYDMIVFLYSTHKADGSGVDNAPCCAWAGGSHIMYQTAWLRDFTAPGEPGEALYHESLHVYDWYTKSRRHAYTGVDSVHGAEIHGYAHGVGAPGWQNYYRDLARGQVAELNTMRLGDVTSGIPDYADLYVGVFDTMRFGSLPN